MKAFGHRRARLLQLLAVTTIMSGLGAPALAAGLADAAGADADAAAAPAGEQMEEMIVTATRTATSIQKVPISMQALSTEMLANRQVKGLTDFAVLLPSISFAGIGPGRNALFFRGVVPAGGNYASVGYYLDEVPITGTNVPDVHAYDLERIEALSGPQGTLFGAGSLAGTVRLITAKPKLGTFEAGYDVEGNKFGPGTGGGQLQGFINVPVTDRLAVRAMAYVRHEGGYIDNTPNNGKFNDGSSSVLGLGDNNPRTSFTLDNSRIAKNNYNSIDEVGGRLSILWEPVEGWSLLPSVSAQQQISRGYFGFDPRLGDLQVHDYDSTRNQDQWAQAALTVHGHIGDFDLVSSTGYFRRNIKTLNDYTYYTVTYDRFGAGYENYLQFFDRAGCTGSGASLRCNRLINPTQFYHADRNERKFTQEIRLTTPKSWPFDVTVGGFYQHQKNELNTYYSIHGLDTIAGYTQAGGGDRADFASSFGVPTTTQIGTTASGAPVFGSMVVGTPAVKEDGFYIVEQNQTYRDAAIFAEGHYEITPTLKVTGGIRYFWTEFNLVGFAGVQASAANTDTSLFVPTNTRGCPTPLSPTVRLTCLNTNRLAADQTGRYREQGETHKVAIDWQFQPDKMVYFNYSTGFRPGGYNRPLRIRATPTTPAAVVAAPAFKSEELTNFELGFKTTWNNVFRFNTAIYLEKWNNIQYGVVVAGAQGAGYTGNAGKAEIKGIEYNAELKLGKFTINSNGAYNDGKLKGNFCNFVADPIKQSIVQLANCAKGVAADGTNIGTPSVAAADGTRLPRQPKFKGTTSARYDTMLGEFNAYVMGAALYQTGATQDLNETNNSKLGNTAGFVSFDFSAGIKKDKWTLDLFIQNAFDRRGGLTRNTFCSIDFCANSSRLWTIRPQFFGVKYGRRF